MSDQARILDRGYRHYDGERGGTAIAVRSVALQGVQRVLGIRRPVWAKLVPVLTAFIAYVPAIVFIGFAVLDPTGFLRNSDPSDYAEYYGFITAAIVLFVAFVGPEVLCPDRRTGMLGLYLASPLSRDTYLIAKAIAIGSVLALVTLGPPLLLLIGNVVAGAGPDGPLDFVGLLARMVLAAAAVTAIYAALSMAVSSVTTRHAAASAAIIIILLSSAIVSNVLIHEAEGSAYLALLDLFALPFEVVVRIYNVSIPGRFDDPMTELPNVAVFGAYGAWTLGLAAFVRIRYQRLAVSR